MIAALTVCWAGAGYAGRQAAGADAVELVAVLRRFGELVIDDGTAALLVAMSAATIDRRLAPERNKHQLKGRRDYQAGVAAQKSDPGAHLGRLGRRETRVR